MTMQDLLNQLAQLNFKVETSKKIKDATSQIGVIQEIKFYGSKNISCSVHFPGTKWEVWFSNNEMNAGKYSFSLRDLKTAT